MKVERTAVPKKIFSILTVTFLIFSIVLTAFSFSYISIIGKADIGNIANAWDNTTTLNVSITHMEPRILWYDFQYLNGSAWESRLNAQIDVNNNDQYRFIRFFWCSVQYGRNIWCRDS